MRLSPVWFQMFTPLTTFNLIKFSLHFKTFPSGAAESLQTPPISSSFASKRIFPLFIRVPPTKEQSVWVLKTPKKTLSVWRATQSRKDGKKGKQTQRDSDIIVLIFCYESSNPPLCFVLPSFFLSDSCNELPSEKVTNKAWWSERTLIINRKLQTEQQQTLSFRNRPL